jgi:hypothetical protein
MQIINMIKRSARIYQKMVEAGSFFLRNSSIPNSSSSYKTSNSKQSEFEDEKKPTHATSKSLPETSRQAALRNVDNSHKLAMQIPDRNSKLVQQKIVAPQSAEKFFSKLKVFTKVQSKSLIINQSLFVDNKPANLATRVDPTSKIDIKLSKQDFDIIFSNIKLFMLYKPKGYVGDETDRTNKGRLTILDIAKSVYKHEEKLYPCVCSQGKTRLQRRRGNAHHQQS